MLNIAETQSGLLLEVVVQPRSSRNQIVGEHDGLLKIKITAPPVEGEANQALVAFLSQKLKLSKSQIRLAKGESSRHKTLLIKGLNREQLLKKLGLE